MTNKALTDYYSRTIDKLTYTSESSTGVFLKNVKHVLSVNISLLGSGNLESIIQISSFPPLPPP